MKGSVVFSVLLISVGVLVLAGVEHYRPNAVMAALINASDLKSELVVENKITGNYTLTPNGVKLLTEGAFVAILVGILALALEAFLSMFRREAAPRAAKEVA